MGMFVDAYVYFRVSSFVFILKRYILFSFFLSLSLSCFINFGLFPFSFYLCVMYVCDDCNYWSTTGRRGGKKC